MIQTLVKLIFLFIVPLSLYGQNTLQSLYYIDNKDINISNILKDIQTDITLYKFQDNRYTKRVKSRELIKLLHSYGYPDFTPSSRYVKFIKKSPINLSKITASIKEFYINSYPDIMIESITVLPRGYVKFLPKEYLVNINAKNNLSNKGTVYIKTQDNKKIFFDYKIVANINLFMTKQSIKRGEELSFLNVEQKNVQLSRFRALPVQEIKKATLQSKHNIKTGKMLTIRDVETINLVKRNATVSVNLNNNAIVIEFSAKALQNGKLNDIITVQKSNKKRIKVVVIGKNKVEIR